MEDMEGSSCVHFIFSAELAPAEVTYLVFALRNAVYSIESSLTEVTRLVCPWK
jgi:hypothetical protein